MKTTTTPLKDQIFHEKAVCPHCESDVYVRYQKKPQLQILGLVDTDGVVTNTNNNSDIYVIYDFWNSQHIVTHRNMTHDIASTIKAELKNYSDVEILQAIKNYAEIQKGDQYWFNYAWTLKDFLKRGIAKFLDLEIAKRNYLKPGMETKQKNLGAIFTASTAEDIDMLTKYRKGLISHDEWIDYTSKKLAERNKD